MFNIIDKNENTLGCQASWNYFKSGHRKSACDGLGGPSKRNADNAVKQDKAVITCRSPESLLLWVVVRRLSSVVR